MYICICGCVSEEEVLKAKSQGITNLDDIFQATGAGGCCGACKPSLIDILKAPEPKAPQDPNQNTGK